MKFVWYGLLILVIGFLFTQSYRLMIRYQVLNRELLQLIKKTEPVMKENETIAHDLKRLENPDAMLRELRRAGYAAPGEKTFVIVPKQ